MAAARNVIGDRVMMRDEEEAKEEEDDSPSGKKPKSDRFPFSTWELGTVFAVFIFFSTGLCCIYFTMPPSVYANLKLPRSISDLRTLKDHIGTYASDYPSEFILGYCSTYIFMQTFMIPAGASSCYFLSKLIGRPIVNWLWPEKLRLFQSEIAKRRERLLNYMLFLRVTPTLPNLFINLASPIVDIPFHVFFLATLLGLIPASYVTVRAGLALGDLRKRTYE
ncbi:SNARE associated Golgi protein family [Euphorbia peplus]|nr:SNARE associated Golgi protein family [Euphorbia peplus]